MAFSSPKESKSKTLPPPPNDEHCSRPKVRSGDLCAGCIVWLPSDSCDKNIKCCKRNCCGKSLGEDGYNNPVVILKIRQRKGSSIRGDLICWVANITTFNNMSLKSYLSKCPHNPEFQQSLPISVVDQDSCVESTPSWLLRLQKGTLKRQSYVNLGHIFKVPASMLSTYGFRSHRAYKLRLSATSYNILMAEIGLRNEPYEDTALLYKTARSRLEVLANQNRQMPTANSAPAHVTFVEDEPADVERKKYPVTPLPFRELGSPKSAPTTPLLPLKERRNVSFNLDEIPKSKRSSPSRFPRDYGTIQIQQSPLVTPYPTAPPTPQTARYHSFSPYVDRDWKRVAMKMLAGCLGLGSLIGAIKMWSTSLFTIP